MRHTFNAVFAAGLSVATALALGGPVRAQDARQRDKNAMRNLGVTLGAAAVYEATKGKRTEALVLGAGAAYAGKKYEDARKAQSREDNPRRRLGRRDDDLRTDENRRYDDRYDTEDRDGERRVRYYRRDGGERLGTNRNQARNQRRCDGAPG